MKKQLENKYLSDEQNILLNIHRFDQLIDINPQLYQLIMNVNSVQKQIIRHGNKNSELSSQIERYEKLYTHLTKLLSYKYGSEIYAQIELYEKEIQSKSKQLQSIDIQLNIAINNVKQHKFTQHQIDTELKLIKSTYIHNKLKHEHSQQSMSGAHDNEWQPNDIDILDTTQLTGYNLDLTQLVSYDGDQLNDTLPSKHQYQLTSPTQYDQTITITQQQHEYTVG